MTIDATSRIAMVKEFDQKECEAALQVNHLQKSVEKAVFRRLKQIQKDRIAARRKA